MRKEFFWLKIRFDPVTILQVFPCQPHVYPAYICIYERLHTWRASLSKGYCCASGLIAMSSKVFSIVYTRLRRDVCRRKKAQQSRYD